MPIKRFYLKLVADISLSTQHRLVKRVPITAIFESKRVRKLYKQTPWIRGSSLRDFLHLLEFGISLAYRYFHLAVFKRPIQIN